MGTWVVPVRRVLQYGSDTALTWLYISQMAPLKELPNPGVPVEGCNPELSEIYLPVRLYHVPFFGYLILGSRSYNHKVGYPKKWVWYEPTGTDNPFSAGLWPSAGRNGLALARATVDDVNPVSPHADYTIP